MLRMLRVRDVAVSPMLPVCDVAVSPMLRVREMGFVVCSFVEEDIMMWKSFAIYVTIDHMM